MDSITTRGDRFVDQAGRQRIFHGVNLVYKGERLPGGAMNYIPPWDEQDFKELSARGFNGVRLGLIWDGVEPQPGAYDEGYLAWARRMLDLCESCGLYAFLDMHQDLYSARFGDGAPPWATLTDAPFEATDLWSDAYLFSPAVQEALDAFWQNRPDGDGVGLQDRYAAMWRHIAGRLGGHPALIGYDFMNEPNPGSAGAQVFGLLMEQFAGLQSRALGREVSPGEAAAAFSDPQGKLSALDALKDKAFYLALAEACRGPVTAFERGDLDRFYNKLTAAVRAVTDRGIIFRENSYFSNMGIRCDALPVQGAAGREPRQAYAPHGYDLVVDTQALGQASNARADVIFSQHRQTQTALHAPVLVGEWGAFGRCPDVLGHAAYLTALFDRWQWSDTYWCYGAGFFDAPVMTVLHRSYPQAVAGTVTRYRGDAASFTMHWQDDINCTLPTVVYLRGQPRSIALGGEYTLDGSRLTIPPMGGARSLRVDFESAFVPKT